MFTNYWRHPNCYFQPSPTNSLFLWSLHIFLSLFPLSTNFPLIAITFSNNLMSLFLSKGRMYSYLTRILVTSLLPPTCVAFATHSLEFLVGITGSYAVLGSSKMCLQLWCIMQGMRLGLHWGSLSGTIIRASSSTGCGSCSCSCGPSPASCSQHGTTLSAHCRRKHLILVIVTKIAKLMLIYYVYRTIYSYIDIPESIMSCIESALQHVLFTYCACVLP